MAREFLMQFPKQSFTVGQQLVFSFEEKKLLALNVKEIEGIVNWPFMYCIAILSLH